jgi:hypothetical protein
MPKRKTPPRKKARRVICSPETERRWETPAFWNSDCISGVTGRVSERTMALRIADVSGG